MARFVGIKNNRIHIISDKPFQSDNITSIELPAELSGLEAADLIVNYKVSDGKIVAKIAKKKASEMRVAFVTNYRMACGLSSYIENLIPELAKYIGEFKLFIEENDNPTGDIYSIGEQKLHEDQVSICWKRGQSLQKLVQELKLYNPDLILINHEFGIFPLPSAWISMMTQLNEYRTIVIAHSVFPYHQDKTIIEAASPEIITHLEEGRNALQRIKGIKSLVHVIPHGCYSIVNKRLWNFYRSKHTILQMGYGFKYKRFEKSIEAVAKLKEKYKDIFLTILFSESDFNLLGHQLYYNELIDLIETLELKEHVGIIRGFQSDSVTDSYLLTNKILALPYSSEGENLVYGSSGMVRKGFASQMAVITSNIPHFSDTPSIKCESVTEMVNEIDLLFSDLKLYKQQIDKQNNFVNENNWHLTAQRYIKVLEESIA